MNTFLAVFIGGGLGSITRYGLSLWIKTMHVSSLPFATLSANVLSTFILGLVVLSFKNQFSTPWVFALIAIGFCGGFSTFSTFSLETFQLIKTGQLTWAITNVLVSLIACLAILFFISKTVK